MFLGENFLGEKSFKPKKVYGQKKFLVEKRFLAEKSVKPTKVFGRKKCLGKKSFGAKMFLVEKSFRP